MFNFSTKHDSYEQLRALHARMKCKTAIMFKEIQKEQAKYPRQFILDHEYTVVEGPDVDLVFQGISHIYTEEEQVWGVVLLGNGVDDMDDEEFHILLSDPEWLNSFKQMLAEDYARFLNAVAENGDEIELQAD